MSKRPLTIVNSAYVILFSLAISLPLVFMLLDGSGVKDEISAAEKRRLAPMPKIVLNRTLLTEFPEQFTRYFDDHYGFRESLIEHSKWLKRELFNKSPVPVVVRGDDGWLFLDTRESLFDHIGLVPMNDTILANWQQHLLNKQQWLASKGITYIFVPVPNKMTIYPEYLPLRVRNHAGSTMLDKLFVYLKQQQKFDAYVDLEPMLYANKNLEDPLYFTTDTHWTSHGAFLGYQHIMRRLQTLLPELDEPLARSEMKQVPVRKKTDLNMIFRRETGLREASYNLKANSQCAHGEYIEVPEFEDTEAYQMETKKKTPLVNGCETKTLTAIIVRDSFGSFVADFFSESFKRVIFMTSYDLVGMENFIDKEKPDVFIDLRVERNVKFLLKHDSRIEQALLKQRS